LSVFVSSYLCVSKIEPFLLNFIFCLSHRLVIIFLLFLIVIPSSFFISSQLLNESKKKKKHQKKIIETFFSLFFLFLMFEKTNKDVSLVIFHDFIDQTFSNLLATTDVNSSENRHTQWTFSL